MAPSVRVSRIKLYSIGLMGLLLVCFMAPFLCIAIHIPKHVCFKIN